MTEEDLLIWSDARRLADRIEDRLTDAIIAVNFGVDELDHAPRFIFRTEPPMDRAAEVNRIKGALDIGLDVSLEEAMQKLGVREVRDHEPYLRRVARPAPFGMVPLPPAPEIVYPSGQAPSPGELAEQPDVALNLPGGGGGLLPPASPPPAELTEGDDAEDTTLAVDDPDLDGVDDATALAAKMTELGIERCVHNKPNRCRICGIERKRDVEMGSDGQPVWSVEWKKIPDSVRNDGRGAWLVLLARARPQLTAEELDAIELAPIDELRWMVQATEQPSAAE